MLTEHIQTKESGTNCAAKKMTPSARQQISLQGLARTEPVSQLAKKNQVSRRFVYRQMAKGKEALAQAFNSRESESEVLFWIPVTKSWLKQVVLALVLCCHSSFRGVISD